MRKYLTANDHFSEILMQRTADPRAVFIVEGVTDLGIMIPFVADEQADIKEFGGKPAALSVIELCNSYPIKNVIALVDADFDRLSAEYNPPENVVLTDHYDLEATILRSGDVLDRFVSNHFDHDKVQATKHRHSTGVRELAERIGRHIGYARYIVKKEDLPISFQNVPIESFINFRSVEIELDRLLRVMAAKSSASESEINSFTEAVRELGETVHDAQAYAYCRGHDLVQIISVLGRKIWGSSTGSDQAERALRSSFDRNALESTALYHRVQAWCERNQISVWKAR